ncbi:MAG TPA: hypothetical protein VFV38_12940 [Ktedonobacteraceae bacterium]|nr:hypothetical protein [Ktedonobacteraceae bacterium]
MEERVFCEPTSSSASVFVLPGLLPAEQRLLLDPETHTALLLTVAGADAFSWFRFFPLTPSATQVFLTLLQAYPRACSYQSLFRSLYPLASTHEEREEVWESKLAVPPIRRALKALLPTLRSLGWQVISLRGQGYLLACAGEPASTPRAQGRPRRECSDAPKGSPKQIQRQTRKGKQ